MSPEQARQELARRELARRQAQQTPQNQQANVSRLAAKYGLPENTSEADVRSFLQNRQDQAQQQSDRAGQKDRALTNVLRPLNAVNRFANSATLGVPDRLAAAADPTRTFKDIKDDKKNLRDQFPVSSTTADLGGAIFGIGKLNAAKALPSAHIGTKGLGRSTLAYGADGAAIAGTEALINGKNPLKATSQGGAIGAGANILTRGASRIASPLVNNIKARLNPDQMARNQLIAALQKSGQSLDDFKAKFQSARDDGAGEFMVADALGKQGQSLASGVARQPGEGGQRLVEALNARQSGQASRVVNALDDAFKTGGQTADEATAAISQNIRATDKANFARVPDEAVNPSTAMKLITDSTKATREGAKPTKVERALSKYGDMIRSSGETGTNTQRMITIRQDVADAADKAFRAGNGGLGTKLKELKTAIDDDILAVSPAYQQANAASSQLRGVRDQIAAGQTAATRGREQDIVNALRQQSPEQRAAFATGFADRNIEGIQRASEGVNTANRLTGQKFRDVSKELTEDGGEKLSRQIKREKDMFATRQRAAGGSLTANNLADQANVNGQVRAGLQLFNGDPSGVAAHLFRGGLNRITGQTERSRNALADMLMKTSDDTIVREVARRIKAGEKLTEAQKKAMVPLLAGGVAVTSGSQ